MVYQFFTYYLGLSERNLLFFDISKYNTAMKKNEVKKLVVYDVTLREGAQGAGGRTAAPWQRSRTPVCTAAGPVLSCRAL